MEGLHTELPVSQIGIEASKLRYNLWWTIYIIDQRISSSVGGPMSIPEDAITATLLAPDDLSQRDATLSLHVQVSRLIYEVLTSK